MKRLMLVLAMFAMVGVASAQVSSTSSIDLTIQRFNASTASGANAQSYNWNTHATLINGQTDTTEWYQITALSAVDSLIEAVWYSKADTAHGAYVVQWAFNKKIISKSDSGFVSTNAGTAGYASAIPLFFRRPAGANQLRVIFKAWATGNADQTADATYATYSIGINKLGEK